MPAIFKHLRQSIQSLKGKENPRAEDSEHMSWRITLNQARMWTLSSCQQPECRLGQEGKEGRQTDRNGSSIYQGSRTGMYVSLEEEAQRSRCLMDEKGSA